VNTKADDLLKQYTDISNKVAAAQQASDAAQNAVDTVTGQSVPHPERASQLPKLRQAAAEAAAQLAILQVQQQALGDKYRSIISDNSGISTQLAVVENAVSTGSNRTTRAEQWGLGGLAAGCVLALVLATVLERRPGSVRERPHPVPGTVTDPHDSGSPTVARGPLSRSLTGPGDRTD
jgi:uncharacterized protein involved in exopolysaccharide biosynthesis